ncbi:MAG: Gfo/Idh/MocA family oxidoreductase [Verrucomicrobia bacterium]|nr:Gfo/Idh/MocA family oxidoreductase [Verrucomicrobiota bacterium]
MKPKFRIAALGLSHDHVWENLKDLQGVGPARLVAVAEPHRALRVRAQNEFGCAAYADYETLLRRELLDAVLIFADNATGAKLARLAAKRGLHVLIEKPLATNLAGADRVLAAARRARVRLMVNWPVAWWPQLRHALVLAAAGKIGRVWQVKYRAAHNGPREMGASKYFCDWLYDQERNGGGAFIDYCCYGAALARLLLGRPRRVTAVAGRLCKGDMRAEDNAVLLMSYPHALAVAEASWTQIGYLTTYVTAIYGTTGTLLVEPGAAGRLLLATKNNPTGAPVKVPPSPAHLKNATAHFIHCLRTGGEFHPLCSARVGRDAQEILEFGMRSVKQGRGVALPLRRKGKF